MAHAHEMFLILIEFLISKEIIIIIIITFFFVFVFINIYVKVNCDYILRLFAFLGIFDVQLKRRHKSVDVVTIISFFIFKRSVWS